MSTYSGTAERPDKAKAIGAVLVVHALLAAIILTGLNAGRIGRAVEQLTTIAIIEPPPPPRRPPVPARKPQAMKKPAGAPARKAEAAPVVAPQPRIPLPSPIPAAKVAGTGAAPSSGASSAGSGTGAGGPGNGAGGGGDITIGPRLIAGAPTRSDYYRLGAWISGPTQALLRLTISPEGRVIDCALVGSSGYPSVDARLCPTLAPPMQWAPARDRAGRPVTSWLVYVVTLHHR